MIILIFLFFWKLLYWSCENIGIDRNMLISLLILFAGHSLVFDWHLTALFNCNYEKVLTLLFKRIPWTTEWIMFVVCGRFWLQILGWPNFTQCCKRLIASTSTQVQFSCVALALCHGSGRMRTRDALLRNIVSKMKGKNFQANVKSIDKGRAHKRRLPSGEGAYLLRIKEFLQIQTLKFFVAKSLGFFKNYGVSARIKVLSQCTGKEVLRDSGHSVNKEVRLILCGRLLETASNASPRP